MMVSIHSNRSLRFFPRGKVQIQEILDYYDLHIDPLQEHTIGVFDAREKVATFKWSEGHTDFFESYELGVYKPNSIKALVSALEVMFINVYSKFKVVRLFKNRCFS